MTKEFVSYEHAKALKELGFDEHCFGEWQNLKIGKNLVVDEEDRIYNVAILGADINAPLKQQALRWFREKHNLVHSITFKHTKDNVIKGINSVYYDIEIYTLQGGDAYRTYLFQECTNLYEKAEDICIDKLIEIVKNK